MNNHKIACIVLIVLIGAMGYGVNFLREKSAKAGAAADATRTQAEMAEQQAQVAEIKLKTIDAKTAALRTIYEEWLPHFEAFKNPQDGERRIAEVIRDGNIFLLSQKLETRKIETEGVITHALVADLVVEDDYSKTMNWLGKVEELIPSCRISSCLLTRGDSGNNIHMELSIQVPVFKSSSTVAQN